MPDRDGAGPRGKGPKTGRGLGSCPGPRTGRPPRDGQGRRRNRPR